MVARGPSRAPAARRGASSVLAPQVAERIREARRARGMTQERLAAILDIATKNVQRMESGRQNLSLGTIERVAGALGVPPSELLLPTSSAPPATVRSPLERLRGGGFRVATSARSKASLGSPVAVMTLRAAAGRFTEVGRSVDVLGWVDVHGAHPGSFVAEIRGASMEPLVPDRSLCLFKAPAPGSLKGRVVLIAHRALAAGDMGEPYALKRVAGLTRTAGGATRVTLASENPRFSPITLTVGEDEGLVVVADLVRVLI